MLELPGPHAGSSSGPVLSEAQVAELIVLSRPRAPFMQSVLRVLPLLLLGLSVALLLLAPAQRHVRWQLGATGLLVAAMAMTWARAHGLRRLHRLHARSMEALRTRQWPDAAAALDRLLSRPVERPELRATALLAAAEVASHELLHESTITLCEEVLAATPDARLRQLAGAEKAMALLQAQRLTDANAVLESLRGQDLGEPLRTMVAAAALYQRIQTGHHADAAALADQLASRARLHLHQRAGYVYALLALALEQLGQPERAQAFYDCATRLIRPAELARRFRELAGLDGRLQPARRPL